MELKYCPDLIKETIKKRIGFLHYLIPNFFSKNTYNWGFIPSDHSFDYKILIKES